MPRFKVDEQIGIANESICNSISKHKADSRGFLSQAIILKLRTFVEAIAVKCAGETHYEYEIFKQKGKPYIKARGNLKFLKNFHDFLQRSVSHYIPEEEDSERLMLKYYEYLLKIKKFLHQKYGIFVLQNIKLFPIYVDPLLKEYYQKISEKIENPSKIRRINEFDARYYIRKKKPFFIGEEIYYEITFTTAIDNVSKFDRVIAFTKIEILSNYAVKFSVVNDEIDVFGKSMPIHIIDNWKVSIRPCELNRFANIFGDHSTTAFRIKEVDNLMYRLSRHRLSLLDVVELSDPRYQKFRTICTENARSINFFPILDKARTLIRSNRKGSNIVRYLLHSINNKILKQQYNDESCRKLSGLNLKWGCIPFDEMPFVTSLLGHNPRIQDLFQCIGIDGHEHEFLARVIKNNTEINGSLYTEKDELNHFSDIESLIRLYNNRLYPGHRPQRDIEEYKGHFFIHSFESNTLKIIQKLTDLSNSGIENYSNTVKDWLDHSAHNVDCEHKKQILQTMFEDSNVALIYGSAGTGKTRLIEHISHFFHDKEKLYLANTNPAVTNLKNRITAENSEYLTIAKFLKNADKYPQVDILFIDECSTVSNQDMFDVLNKNLFKLLVLVGDIYQIESIRFGNWFESAKYVVPNTSSFELTTPYRTENKELLSLWDKVRNIEIDIIEHITSNNYSTTLNDTVFQSNSDDEIILCLNYDGLYGINNINRFLQGNNNNQAVQWGVHTYKVDDPILFNESSRFKPLIHNNLKGKILEIENLDEKLKVTVEINKSINGFDAHEYDFNFLGSSDNGGSIISFDINRLKSTDEDEDSPSTVAPFQVAYAVSIHKAQGLEYDSVKVVVTEETEELITHNIFYTAITRAKKNLKIYWTPDTENRILSKLKKRSNPKDVCLLREKYQL